MAYISFMLFFLSFLRTVQYLYAQGWQSHQRRKGNTATLAWHKWLLYSLPMYFSISVRSRMAGWLDRICISHVRWLVDYYPHSRLWLCVACAVNIVRVDETTKHHDPLDLLCGASICTTEVIVGGKVGFVRTEDCTIVSIPAVAAKSLDATYALIWPVKTHRTVHVLLCAARL